MARKRVDTAPQFNVGADSVLIQQVSGSTSTIFEVKNSAGASVMAIDSSGATTATFAAGVGLPVGMITPFAGSTAPTGWFLCGGQAVSRTTYASLFAVISTTYGVGDGSTTFNLPDLRGRSVAGVDNMGGTDAGRLDIANSSGTVVGSQYVTLTSAQSGLPAHQHANTLTNNAVTSGAGSAHSHASTASFSGSFTGNAASHTHTQNAHEHTLFFPGALGGNRYMIGDYAGGGTAYWTPGNFQVVYASAVSNYSIAASNTATNQNTSITPSGSISGGVSMSNPSESTHTHSVTSNVSISNVNNTAANASESHSVMQPTMVLNYIVRY
jgi:microcystin-dependent protein